MSFWGILIIIIIIIIIIIKSGQQRKAGRESYLHSISPKTTGPQYQPIDRKQKKEKIIEDIKGQSSLCQ